MPEASAGIWAWAALAGLGSFHGFNPAMGWLFAVARGLQSGRRATVFGSLPPIALGHMVSIAAVITSVEVLREIVSMAVLQVLAASALIGFGAWRLARGYRHRFRVGMVAGFGDLTLWSFLMATAHGAGLMLAPVLLLLPTGDGLLALGTHTAAMFVVMGLTAWLVFDWVGLALLRRGWINLDLVWSGVLIGVGAFLLATATAHAGDLHLIGLGLGGLLRICGG
jgi:hypothetical protein